MTTVLAGPPRRLGSLLPSELPHGRLGHSVRLAGPCRETTVDVVFRALGPVGVECGGTALTLRPMEQALLAVLLARSRHWASTDELVDALWPDHPARNATNSLR